MKYFTTIANLKQTLHEYGVAIIPSVLDSDECAKIVSKIWDFFEHITQKWPTPINRANEASWTEFYKLFPIHSMLVQYWNIAHSQACWDVRQNPKIVDIYSHLYNCSKEEMLVSFDGLSFNLPPKQQNVVGIKISYGFIATRVLHKTILKQFSHGPPRSM